MPSEQSAAGTYLAKCKWGTAVLVLKPDHTFTETLHAPDGLKNGSGTWNLQPYDGGGNNIHFEGNFLMVDNETQGRPSPDVRTYIQNVFGDVTIVNDPDESETSFSKQTSKRS
jgi:hypothetical protein